MGFSYQLYSSRNFPPLSDTLTMLGNLGYDQVEGYGALFTGLDDPARLRAQLDAVGLRMTSAHFGLQEVQSDPGRVIELSRVLGIEVVFVPFIAPEDRPTDAGGWVNLGNSIAEAGKPLKDAGFAFGYHNHDFEFAAVDGQIPLELLLSADGDLDFEFDVAWAVFGGQNPLDWINKYSSRIIAAHMKDISIEGAAKDEDGWADVGHGIMDWSGLAAALRTTACRYFVMEHDNPNDHRRFASRSIAVAQSL